MKQLLLWRLLKIKRGSRTQDRKHTTKLGRQTYTCNSKDCIGWSTCHSHSSVFNIKNNLYPRISMKRSLACGWVVFFTVFWVLGCSVTNSSIIYYLCACVVPVYTSGTKNTILQLLWTPIGYYPRFWFGEWKKWDSFVHSLAGKHSFNDEHCLPTFKIGVLEGIMLRVHSGTGWKI
jgi:hypothetical protein